MRSLSHSAKISAFRANIGAGIIAGARNIGAGGRRVAKQFHPGGARPRRRRQRIFFALSEICRSASASASRSRSCGSSSRSAALRRVLCVKPDRARRKTRHSRWMRPAGLVCAAGVGRKMLGVAQRGRILAMARQRGAGGRGAQGQALAQRPGERRIEANNLIQQSEPGAGEESRAQSPRRRRRRARSAAAPRTETPCCNSGLAGAKNSARRAGARDVSHARRASPGGSAAGVSSSKDVGGRESDHGFSITQGGALSPIFRAKSAALVLRK